jgi:FkbM family methyltransferase
MSRWRRPLGNMCMKTLATAVVREDVARRLFHEVQEHRSSRPGRGDGGAERAEFLAFCWANRHAATGQLLQDLWVLYETRQKANGYFVEFGAVDGIAHSNTLGLERRHGWQGILAEPNPEMATALRRNRGVSIDTRCVWTESSLTKELLIPEDPELSTIAHSENFDSHREVRARTGVPVNVETVGLGDLLSQHDAPPSIDYMSVDTEGSEFEILASFDFAKWRVDLLTIEHNHRQQQTALDSLMLSQGYERRFPELSQFDAWYRRRQAVAA